MRSFGVVFGGIWLLVGLGFAATSTYFLAVERRFAREALVAEGIVLVKEVHRSRDWRSSKTSYAVSYRFKDADGHDVEGLDQVDRDGWNRYVERGPIRVAFLPDRPRTNRVAGESNLGLLLMFFALGVVLSAVGGTIAFRTMRSAAIRDRLLQTGASAQGTIREVAPTNFFINGRQQWRLVYEYRDLAGQSRRGKERLDPEQARLVNVGDSGTVRFDVRRPDRAVWVGDDDGNARAARG